MDLVNAASSPYLAQQVINLGYIILNKIKKFTTGIRECNNIPHNQRMGNFLYVFSQTHWELRKSGELEIYKTHFNTANLVQEVTWPGLTVHNMVKLIIETNATALGHYLDQNTKTSNQANLRFMMMITFPPQHASQMHEAVAALVPF